MTDAGESDEALIGRYARGDAAAFVPLYRRHEMRVWRYLERNVGNRATADELMQEVWFAVARDAARYEPTSRFTTWLFTIARNRMIDSIRTSRQQVSLETLGYEAELVVQQLTTAPNAGPLAAVVVRDQAAALTQALDNSHANSAMRSFCKSRAILVSRRSRRSPKAASRQPKAVCAMPDEAARAAQRVRMSKVPPSQDQPDDVDDQYRRASALDPSRPSEAVRRAVLAHAAQLVAKRATRRAVNQAWWRPAIFGTLAAAALAGLVVAPRFLALRPPPAAATPAAEGFCAQCRPSFGGTGPRHPDR